MKASSTKINFIVFSLCIFSLGCSEDTKTDKGGKNEKSPISTRVIYGEDNRVDLYEVTNPAVVGLARSTVALMPSASLQPADDGKFDLRTENFGTTFNLCPSESFAEQDTVAFCSGFLVAPNMIATAGHCVRDMVSCRNTKFVFDYSITEKGQKGPQNVDAENVYDCKRLVKSYVDSRGADFAVIEIDRPVTDRQALAIRESGTLGSQDELMVIGHPSGIPLKVAAGAHLRNQATGFFVANLDTYGGNSGSAVLNTITGEVEGILVRGENDYIYQGSCRVSQVCADDGCRGEDVTKIEEIKAYLRN